MVIDCNSVYTGIKSICAVMGISKDTLRKIAKDDDGPPVRKDKDGKYILVGAELIEYYRSRPLVKKKLED